MSLRPMPLSPYDGDIKQAVSVYLPKHYDWRLLKSQFWQESRFKPFAKSPAGALGFAQFMPATWREAQRELPLVGGLEATDATVAIPAGAWYMRKMYNIWNAPRPEIDRVCLAMASYNAGVGNLLKAQRKADGANAYRDIVAQLHRVTGENNSYETINYVRNILAVWVNDVLNQPEGEDR